MQHGHRDHIDRYLIPRIGRITLASGKRVQACFNLLSRQRTKNGTPIAASTVDRVRATPRSALNAAVRDGLITAPLTQVRLDKPVRPHPVIWTDERVEAWRRDGIRTGPGCAAGTADVYLRRRSADPDTARLLPGTIAARHELPGFRGVGPDRLSSRRHTR